MTARRDSESGPRGGRVTKRGKAVKGEGFCLRIKAAGFSVVLAFGFSSLLAITPRSTGQEAKNQQPTLQYEVSVTVKLIQVYVTDNKGKPVQDLTKEDFAVFDNGKPVTVTEFEKHGNLPLPSETVTEAGAKLIPTAAPPAQKISRKFFLLLDFAYNQQKGVAKAITAASHFLKNQVMPGDEVALLSNSLLKGVTVHEYLTTAHQKVLEAVEAMSAKEIAGRTDEIEERYWKQSGGSPAASSQYNWERQEAKTQAEHYILRLTALAKALRLVSGQKSIILFSTGIPATMIYGYQGRNVFDAGDVRLRPLYEDMIKQFSASSCTFYAFDTRESARVASMFAREENSRSSVLNMSSGFQDASVFRDDKTTGLDSLKRLSDRTGGKFFSNINMYEKNLTQVEEVTRTYFVLGYPVTERWDGRYHEIKVRVKRKGCEVQAQSGYFNPKPYSEFSPLEKELQLYDLTLNEHSPFKAPMEFPIEALTYDAGSGPRVRMLASIPKRTLEGLAGKSVEFVVLVFDERGNLVNLQRTVGNITGRAGKDILFSAGTEAPPGLCRCRLVIRNLETGMSAVASTVANAVKPAQGKLVLYSPLLVTAAPQPPGVECPTKGKPDYFSWQDIYPYEAGTYSPLIGAIPSGCDELLAFVPYSVAGLGQPEIILSFNLVDAATGRSQPVPFALRQTFRTGSVETQVLELSISDVLPGGYLLYFHAGDAVSKSIDHRYIPLVISP
jgi:VWFA-related protein